jgi:hypothetical protein
MHRMATVFRLTTILAVTAFITADGAATARDTSHALSLATVSNGVVTYKIPAGPEGLELSSNAPGTITVTSGSNSVTVRGPALRLSGSVVLAPYSTPGVRIMPDTDGAYIAVLEAVLNVLPDAEMPEDAADRLAQDLARELADADFGDRTAERCIAPAGGTAGHPLQALTRSASPGLSVP